MIVRRVLMTVILIGVCSSPVQAGSTTESGGAGKVASSEQAASEAKEGKEAALLGKKRGDAFVSEEDYKNAAEEYVKALSVSPSPFTGEERLQMAIAISWADRLDDANRVLRSILDGNPEDWKARIQLARVLSWSDRLNEAEREADFVLKDHPDNQDALLVKANALRWRGDAAASSPVYGKALAQGENFDARIGLAYAYLERGEKDTAREISKTLKPSYPYQEKELAKFSDSLCRVRASRISFPYSYYKDSDDNKVHRAGLSYGLWFGRWDTELSYRLTDAVDPVRRQKEEYLWITTSARMGRIGTWAGVGISKTDGRNGNVLTGLLRADASMGWGTIDVGVSRDAFTDTAQLIENRIIRTNGTMGFSEVMTPRLTVTESYTRSDYSDSNSADDLRLGARYLLTRAAPKLATGYRFRYWNFRRQSGGGYFDPEDLISHQVFVSLYTEKNGFYVSLEPYTGLQSFTRYGEYTSKSFYGATAAAGWNMRKCTSFEINGESGNYLQNVTDAFRYYLVGFRLIVYF
jgi:thioredoxin-like negative regulator of GroEL